MRQGPPERRFQVMCWFEDRAKTVVYTFWFPDEMTVKEVRGSEITTVADTVSTDDHVTVTWRKPLPYTDDHREALEKHVTRIHRGILDAQAF